MASGSRYPGGMNVTAGGKAVGARLRREVMIPIPAYRQVSSLIGLSLVLVLMASAVDAVVWTYQSQRRIWRQESAEVMRPALGRRHSHRRLQPPANRPRSEFSPEAIGPARPHHTCILPAAGRIPR